jgi:hypothetical protein
MVLPRPIGWGEGRGEGAFTLWCSASRRPLCIVGTLPLPPPVLKYRHYRSGTNDLLNVAHRWGSWTVKKTSDYAGQPQVPWTFPYHGQ